MTPAKQIDGCALGFQEPPAARPGPAGRHGKEEEEPAARPDQSKTLSGAASKDGGAAVAAAAHTKHGKHKKMPAPYHAIPVEVDQKSQNTPADGHGHSDSFEQAVGTVTVKQGESIQVRMNRMLPIVAFPGDSWWFQIAVMCLAESTVYRSQCFVFSRPVPLSFPPPSALVPSFMNVGTVTRCFVRRSEHSYMCVQGRL